MSILTQEEHDIFAKVFPKVKTRCPTCYISNRIENKVKGAMEIVLDMPITKEEAEDPHIVRKCFELLKKELGL